MADLRAELSRTPPILAAIAAGPTPPIEAPLRDVADWHLARVLAQHAGNRTRAAKSLGIDAKTLWLAVKRIIVAADSRKQKALA